MAENFHLHRRIAAGLLSRQQSIHIFLLRSPLTLLNRRKHHESASIREGATMAEPRFSHLSPGDEGPSICGITFRRLPTGRRSRRSPWEHLVLYVRIRLHRRLQLRGGACPPHSSAMATECHAIFGVEMPNWRTADTSPTTNPRRTVAVFLRAPPATRSSRSRRSEERSLPSTARKRSTNTPSTPSGLGSRTTLPPPPPF